MIPSMTKADPHGDQVQTSSTSAASPRALTYDESKAAEAAFRGEPFNAGWSVAALRVYEGILRAKGNREIQAISDSAYEPECMMETGSPPVLYL